MTNTVGRATQIERRCGRGCALPLAARQTRAASAARPWRPDAARRFALAVLALVAVFALPAPAGARDEKPAVYNQKVYFPGTKSYFELVRAEFGDSERGPYAEEISWANANRKALRRTYKGVRGRLAIVRNEETHQFLKSTFRPDLSTWIGLRYWCRYNRLQWVDGAFHDRASYARWDRVWARLAGTPHGQRKPNCLGPNWYWPVHYWSVANGFRWNANDMQKEGFAYLVEYPTGKP